MDVTRPSQGVSYEHSEIEQGSRVNLGLTLSRVEQRVEGFEQGWVLVCRCWSLVVVYYIYIDIYI